MALHGLIQSLGLQVQPSIPFLTTRALQGLSCTQHEQMVFIKFTQLTHEVLPQCTMRQRISKGNQ